jgi:uncharacterized protein (DUF433 family)
MSAVNLGQFLVIDSRVCHGRLTFRGTRVPVQTVLAFLCFAPVESGRTPGLS